MAPPLGYPKTKKPSASGELRPPDPRPGALPLNPPSVPQLQICHYTTTQDIRSRSAILTSGTLTGSLARYKFVPYLLSPSGSKITRPLDKPTSNSSVLHRYSELYALRSRPGRKSELNLISSRLHRDQGVRTPYKMRGNLIIFHRCKVGFNIARRIRDD